MCNTHILLIINHDIVIGNACNIQMFIQSQNGTMFIILTFLIFNLNIKCDNMHKGNDLKTK